MSEMPAFRQNRLPLAVKASQTFCEKTSACCPFSTRAPDGRLDCGATFPGISGQQCKANWWIHMVEKLAVPDTDYAVTVARALNLQVEGGRKGGWIVDEASAFRQLPTLPGDRKVAVIDMCEPSTGAVNYFSMTGHPFGLTASVSNFCRRGLALTNVFGFGLARLEMVQEEAQMVVEVCSLVGVKTNNKVAYGAELDILGVHFNFATRKLAVKDSRQETLELEIRTALDEDRVNSVVNLCLSAVTTRSATAARKSSPLLTGNTAEEQSTS